jgi:hypothetical protein
LSYNSCSNSYVDKQSKPYCKRLPITVITDANDTIYAEEAISQKGFPSKAVINANDTIVYPMLVDKIMPTLTKQMKNELKDETVVLKLLIGKDGLIKDYKPISDTASSGLKQVLETLQNYRFTACTLNRNPVLSWIDFKYNFNYIQTQTEMHENK